MKVRLASIEDKIPVLGLRAYAEQEAPEPEPFGAESPERLIESIERHEVLVAEHDGKICGYVLFCINGPYYSGLHLVVAPGYQKQGIGSALVMEAHELAAKRGAKKAVTMIYGDRMRAFYERTGYEQTGKVMTKGLQ